MIPPFDSDGYLPPGEHSATWAEFCQEFGNSPRRVWLLQGLEAALFALRKAGCQRVWIDGSFVTTKEQPNDFDGCWDVYGVSALLLDPILLEFGDGQIKQKIKFRGELFPSEALVGNAGKVFREFFQHRKDSNNQKGIITIDLRTLS